MTEIVKVQQGYLKFTSKSGVGTDVVFSMQTRLSEQIWSYSQMKINTSKFKNSEFKVV